MLSLSPFMWVFLPPSDARSVSTLMVHYKMWPLDVHLGTKAKQKNPKETNKI